MRHPLYHAASSHVTPDTDHDPDPTWFASQSRHWNIDRPDPR
jgi:hypothetical protein